MEQEESFGESFFQLFRLLNRFIMASYQAKVMWAVANSFVLRLGVEFEVYSLVYFVTIVHHNRTFPCQGNIAT
jgi:hypothetical protein